MKNLFQLLDSDEEQTGLVLTSANEKEFLEPTLDILAEDIEEDYSHEK